MQMASQLCKNLQNWKMPRTRGKDLASDSSKVKPNGQIGPYKSEPRAAALVITEISRVAATLIIFKLS